MQAGQFSIANPGVTQMGASAASASFGGWMTRLFGCWHREMSRPFSRQGQAYRACLSCGAQRRFNLGNWEMQGDYYYYQPGRTHFHSIADLDSVRQAAN
jgi:hypothetical protein